MAGANWHEAVFNAKGEIVHQELFSPGGVEIHFQKNWIDLSLSISSETSPRVWSGQLLYHDVRVWAERGPREGVYAVIESEKEDFVLLGVGLHGYDEKTGAWLGVREPELRHLIEVAGRADVGMPEDPACSWLGGANIDGAAMALRKRLEAGHFKDGVSR